MGVEGKLIDDGAAVRAFVGPTRSDVIHACDVMEDVAIGYGFGKLVAAAHMPQTVTAGAQQPLNKLCDQLRNELAQAQFTEVLTLSLCAHDENFDHLNHADDGSAVRLANPKTQEYQVARTQLYVGLLKALQHNQKSALPLRIFEVSDVVWKSATHDVGARNRRFLCAMFMSTGAGFEHIHGLLDRIMQVLEIPLDRAKGYAIEPAQDALFFDGRCVRVLLRGQPIGIFGVLHPTVLKKFDLPFPVSALHLDVESL
jgi:phenylalanyl-tRNA synthetase beta chain